MNQQQLFAYDPYEGPNGDIQWDYPKLEFNNQI